eukprot:TRINITY_DN3039_c0_g1_i1.p1 TRINITY_DN3039_c0_g1~~TRINITY_DN3039_c0_g1_i1.p1  ORF type:complete len:160 (+),score=36.12 TRINITY_DN3039_c0_g1_i1:35-481(+)
MNTTDIADVQLTKEDEQLAQQITDQIIQQAQQPPEEKLDVETVIKILADHLVAREDIPEERRTTEFHNRVNDLFDLLVLADQAQADLIKLVTGKENVESFEQALDLPKDFSLIRGPATYFLLKKKDQPAFYVTLTTGKPYLLYADVKN